MRKLFTLATAMMLSVGLIFTGCSSKPVQNPVVTMTMESGSVVKMELYPKIAPNTVANFISLIDQKFYDGTTFHRVIPGFVVQGGDPSGNGTGGPGYSIKGEFTENGFKNELKHTKGVLSMARATPPDSAGSQFFIMLADVPSLDNKYAAFGKVADEESMKAVDKILADSKVTDTQMGTPSVVQKVKSMTVDTFGVKYPDVKKAENK